MAGGKWQLEVVKMALYTLFPVGLFHYFNNPGGDVEDRVRAYRDELYGPDHEAKQKALKEAIRTGNFENIKM